MERPRDFRAQHGKLLQQCHRQNGQAMERIAILREQAAVLRKLASSFDVQSIRDQLLDIAARWDEMVRWLEENPQAAGLRPRSSQPDPHEGRR